jgi:hypothetical protein
LPNDGEDSEAWIKKFDSAGNEDIINWNKSLIDWSEYRGIELDPDNNIIVIGTGWNIIYETSGMDWIIKKFPCSSIA